MNEPNSSTDLLEEIARYLSVVDLVRAARCAPTGQPESHGRGTLAGPRIAAHGESMRRTAH